MLPIFHACMMCALFLRALRIAGQVIKTQVHGERVLGGMHACTNDVLMSKLQVG